jgi:hypothetical protein
MAEALIRVKDTEDGKDVTLEVKFFPAIDNNSPAHQAVAEFVKQQNLQEVPKAEG